MLIPTRHLVRLAIVATSLLAVSGCTSWSVLWAESYWRGVQALDRGNLDAAREELGASLWYARSRPSFWVMHVPSLEQLARVAILDDRPDEAVAYLREALSLRRSSRDVPSSIAVQTSLPALGHSIAQSLLTGARLVEVGYVESGLEIHRAYLSELASGRYRADVALAKAGAAGTLAVALVRAGEADRALLEFEKVVKYGVVIGHARTHGLVPIYLEYADLLDSLKRHAEAEELRVVARKVGELPDYFDEVQDQFDQAGIASWNPSELPFRLHAEAPPVDWSHAGEASSMVAEAVADWADTVRPGVPSFVLVDDPTQAQITIRWARIWSAANGVVGHADARIHQAERRIQRVDLMVAIGSPEKPVDRDQVAQVLRHELGHAIGIQGHSPSPGDLMYPSLDRGAAAISARDIATLRHLFPCNAHAGAGLAVLRRSGQDVECTKESEAPGDG